MGNGDKDGLKGCKSFNGKATEEAVLVIWMGYSKGIYKYFCVYKTVDSRYVFEMEAARDGKGLDCRLC